MQLHVWDRPLRVLGLLALAAAMTVSPPAAADEPQPECQRCQPAGNLLGKIPYIGRLFVGGEAGTCCQDAEPIGVEFTIVDGQLVGQGIPAEHAGPPLFLESDCQVCPLPGAALNFVRRRSECCENAAWAPATAACAVNGETKCCAGKCAAACGAKACAQQQVAAGCGLKCGTAECCQQLVAQAAGKTCPVKEHWEEIAELVAANAAMEATLEVREELLEARSEMFETLAQTLIEKAKLEAKLEMVEHRDAMLKEMVELHAENARLKAQTELAQQKEELLRAQLATALENERLKQRVAELEQQRSDEQPVLTSKRAEKQKSR